jgi:hypothetical protein
LCQAAESEAANREHQIPADVAGVSRKKKIFCINRGSVEGNREETEQEDEVFAARREYIWKDDTLLTYRKQILIVRQMVASVGSRVSIR